MELALGIGILLLLFLSGKGGGSDSTNGGALPPSTTDVPGRTKGPGGRGDVWRDPKDVSRLPSSGQFDYSGNGLWIDPECGFVVEGDLFWPDPDAFVRVMEPAPTLEATLSLRDDNTALGFVNYLVEQEGVRDPVDIVWRIVDEAAPMCGQVDPEQWGEAMRIWFNDFLDRVTTYLEEEEIPFGES